MIKILSRSRVGTQRPGSDLTKTSREDQKAQDAHTLLSDTFSLNVTLHQPTSKPFRKLRPYRLSLVRGSRSAESSAALSDQLAITMAS